MDHSKDAVPTDAKPVDVQALMKSDPRFIARLIQQLDTQMHNMQDEKKRRQQSIKEDTEEMQRIDQEIRTHIQPGIVEYICGICLHPAHVSFTVSMGNLWTQWMHDCSTLAWIVVPVCQCCFTTHAFSVFHKPGVFHVAEHMHACRIR